MAPIFSDTNFFDNWANYSAEIPCGSKISSKSLYYARFSRYGHVCVLQFLQKNSKVQNDRQFWRDKIFSKFGFPTLQTYPMGKKFRHNLSISHGFQDIGNLVFCYFCEKFENSNWPPVLARQNFFENWVNYSAEIP